MVLPGTLPVALVLLFLSLLCFGLWPILFKLSAQRWRFQLFAIDFAIGALVLALLAAYTLGTLGADLGFTDSMLVAGRREQAVSVLAGISFAFANICFLAAVALIGLTGASLLTVSVFGCGLAAINLDAHSYLTSSLAIVMLGAAAALVVVAARMKRPQPDNRPIVSATAKPGNVRPNTLRSDIRTHHPEHKPMTTATKGIVTGILAGLGFLGLLPLIQLAQPEKLGIGAYGGILLATMGILGATLCLSFFFFNISLESGRVGYRNYFQGSARDHLPGLIAGAIWAAGALSLYAAQTGAVPLSRAQVWLPPFAGALIAAISGLLFWRKQPPSVKAIRFTALAMLLLIVGVSVLLK